MTDPSWFLKDSVCEVCNFPIVVTQGDAYSDYCYYCSNPDCMRHDIKQYAGDMEDCNFSKRITDAKLNT